MTPSDHGLLHAAHAAAPARGVRITAARGVWHKQGAASWYRFEGPTSLAGVVTGLDEEAVTIRRGDVTMTVLLGEVDDVRADVGFRELATPLSLEEALALSLGDVVDQGAWEVAA